MARMGLFWGVVVAVALLLVVAMVEAAGLVHFAISRGGFFYTAERAEPAAASATADTAVFHPYFAFGVRPGVPIRRFLEPESVARRLLEGSPDAEPAWTRLRANNFGFFAAVDYPVHEPDSFLVGIFGGSVAHSLAMQSGERLAAGLAEHPALRGRRVRVLNFAAGGFKQPQQLLVLAYFLSIGQRFDYVVNIDGFNEAVLGSINRARSLDASMPSLHHLAGLEALTAPSPEALAMRLELETLARRRAAYDEARARARWAGAHLLWDLLRQRAETQHAKLASEPLPRDGARSALALVRELPRPGGDTDGERIAGDWVRGSALLAALCREAGARYLHVLQPNQYVSGRRFGADEAGVALREGSPYARFARSLYPLLEARVPSLREQGIDFADARALFDDVDEIIYADECCHVNQRGNDLLADFVRSRMQLDRP